MLSWAVSLPGELEAQMFAKRQESEQTVLGQAAQGRGRVEPRSAGFPWEQGPPLCPVRRGGPMQAWLGSTLISFWEGSPAAQAPGETPRIKWCCD